MIYEVAIHVAPAPRDDHKMKVLAGARNACPAQDSLSVHFKAC